MNLIDFWILGHILAVFLLAGIFVISNKKLNKGLILTSGILMLWEFYEISASINEPNINRILDLFVGLIFFCLSYNLLKRNEKKLLEIQFTKHESFFDMWSIGHFLTYGLVAIFLFEFKFNLIKGLSIAIPLMVFWEIYERKIGVGESYLNSIFDIIFGIAGFILFYLASSNLAFNFNLAMSLITLEALLMLKLWSNKIE